MGRRKIYGKIGEVDKEKTENRTRRRQAHTNGHSQRIAKKEWGEAVHLASYFSLDPMHITSGERKQGINREKKMERKGDNKKGRMRIKEKE